MKNKVILVGLLITSIFLFLLGDRSSFLYFIFFLIYMAFVITRKMNQKKKDKEISKTCKKR